jgi:hypothetical protein
MTQKPEVGAKYYTPGCFKEIDCITWRDDIVDQYLWVQRKVFLTEEAAREAICRN